MKMLNDRQLSIVDFLSKSELPVSSEEIAKIVMKSKRTVMRDLSTIKAFLEKNEIGHLITNTKTSGYKIVIDNRKEYENFMGKIIDDEKIIIFELINNNYVTMDDLSEILYLSKISVSEKLNFIKEKYSSFLNIEVSNKGHHLNESIEKKCFLLSCLVSENTGYYLEKINLSHREYENLCNAIEHNKDIEEYFPNVISSDIANIFIGALLLKGQNEKENNVEFENIYECSNIKYSKENIATLSDVSDYCISINLNLSISQIEKVLSLIEKEHSIKFKNEKLSSQLYNHLKRILCYPTYIKNYDIHNISNIKALYPFSFDLSIVFINLMEKLYGYQIPNRDLIGLYFTVGMEEMKRNEHKILIYSNINSIANINKELIESSVSNCIVEISDKIDYENIKSFSLVLNGTTKKIETEVDVFSAPYILSEKEISDIKEKLENISINRNIHNIFPKKYSFTYNVKENQTYLEILSDICRQLCEMNAISTDEAARILKREESGNCLVINNFSIPHCISRKENFCMCIYVHLDKNIIVEGNNISDILITMMNANMNKNVNIFKYIYRYLNSNKNNLDNISSYDEFIKYI